MIDERTHIARLLTSIVELYDHLHDEALHAHVTRTTLFIPGGDALNMLGPAANLEAWDNRYETAERAGFTRGSDYAFDQVDNEDHPLLILASWEDIIRDARQQPTDLKATVKRAADYIRSSIDWMLDDSSGTRNFMPIAALIVDLEKVRTRLEVVLHDGRQIDRTRVRCINSECDIKPRLHKVFRAKAAWDFYVCPICRTPYDSEQYLQAKRQNLHEEGADRFVLVADAMQASETSKSTMRSWMRRLDVRTICDTRTRRLLVWWPDVRERAERRQLRSRRDSA